MTISFNSHIFFYKGKLLHYFYPNYNKYVFIVKYQFLLIFTSILACALQRVNNNFF